MLFFFFSDDLQYGDFYRWNYHCSVYQNSIYLCLNEGSEKLIFYYPYFTLFILYGHLYYYLNHNLNLNKSSVEFLGIYHKSLPYFPVWGLKEKYSC